jgi:outer membrane protein
MPRKMLLLELAVFAACVLVCRSAGAADTAGVVDSWKVVLQHPEFDAIAKHIAEMRRQKRSETRFALAKETDPEKKAGMLEAANRDIAEVERRLMSPVYEDCKDALIAVMEKRNITIVLRKASVYFGGTDITEDVIARLKAASESR